MTKIKLDYPSNSISKIGPSEEEKEKPKHVTNAVVVEKEKPLLFRIFGDNLHQVGGYVLWDIIIPAAKNTITEIVSNGIEILLYGQDKTQKRNIRRDRGRSYVSYNSIYNDRPKSSYSSRTSSRHNFDDIVIENRADAEEVLSIMIEAIEQYGTVSVADFYESVGISTDFTDNKWGWTDLSSAYVSRSRDGYYIHLPRPRSLD